MDKRQLIASIQETNHNADTRFLSQFSEQDLAEYLQRLQQASLRNIRLKPHRRPVRREYRAVA
jgi:hypothetical protein